MFGVCQAVRLSGSSENETRLTGSVIEIDRTARGPIFLAADTALAVAIDSCVRPLHDSVAVGQRLNAFVDDLGGERRAFHDPGFNRNPKGCGAFVR